MVVASMGFTRDPVTRAKIPQAIMTHRINGQYIVEGYSAATFCLMAAAGAYLLHASAVPNANRSANVG